MAQTPTAIDYLGLSAIQQYAWENAEEKGFHTEGDHFRARAEAPDATEWDKAALANYYSKRLFLLVSEATEGFEEIRDGRAADEQYTNPVKVGKPEGVVSEIIDGIIRSLDFLQELEVDVADAFKLKSDYNATREFMHGKSF